MPHKKKYKELETELSKKNEDIQNLMRGIEDKDKLLDDYLNTMKLLQADFENYKKRVERDKENLINYAKKDIILKLLELKDNFERALYSQRNNDSTSSDFFKGFEMIYQMLSKLLDEEGVKEIDCMNLEFDPYYHEALMMDDGTEGDIHVICDVFQKGYILKDKVIRHSKVKVRKEKSNR